MDGIWIALVLIVVAYVALSWKKGWWPWSTKAPTID